MTPQIRLKPHLKAHKLSQDEVVLLGEREQYLLRGEVYAALVPLLDGGHDADAMAERLAKRFPRELVYYALMQLEAKGYTLSGEGDGASAGDAAWWSAKGLHAVEVTEKLARTPVVVLNAGTPATAFRTMRSALTERFRVTERAREGGFTVIACHDYLDPRLEAGIGDVLAAGSRILPVRLGGGQIWLGPLLGEGDADLFRLLRQRLASLRAPESAILAKGGTFPLLPVQGVLESVVFGAAAIASAVLATLAGQPPAAIQRGVLALDPWTLEARAHVLAVAKRETLQPAPEIGRERAPITLEPRPKRFASDGGVRSATPEETLARLEPLVSDITGIVPVLSKFPAPDGMYVYAASQSFGSAAAGFADHRQNRVLGQAALAGGKGQSEIQAKVSCLGEAIERYCCSYSGDEPRRRARIDALGDRAVSPPSLLMFSEHQYATRDTFNAEWGGFNWAPMRFDPARAIDWTPAWSLTHQRTMWLPSTFCTIRTPGDRDHDFCRADSNGCAAGNTREEAILQGFLELAERDACAVWWYNRLRRPGINLASFHSPYLDSMAALYARHGRTLVALDITNDLGIPTVVALSWQQTGGRRIHVGLGTHLDGALAVSRAVTELSQSTWSEFLPGHDPAAEKGRNADIEKWLADATIESEPYVLPAPGPQRTAADYPSLASNDLCDDIAACVALLRARGLEMIVLDHTRPDIGFPVMRVVVPGLRHFWARFAPGRLYDVPVAMGWLDNPKSEAELNPKPFFI